jgi:hypothetical protein
LHPPTLTRELLVSLFKIAFQSHDDSESLVRFRRDATQKAYLCQLSALSNVFGLHVEDLLKMASESYASIAFGSTNRSFVASADGGVLKWFLGLILHFNTIKST